MSHGSKKPAMAPSAPSAPSAPVALVVAALAALVTLAPLLFAATTLRADEPAAPPLAEPSLQEPPLTLADRQHWSFQPLRRPSLPSVADASRVENAIDLFVQARLEKAGLSLQPPAAPRALARRLAIDITGLPPSRSPGDEAADANDADGADAYERRVDRLLASPAAGPRAAQPWLDLARWAETDGFEHDKVRRDAWQYRDWVVAAFNRDLPYHHFVQAQLAGDEFLPSEPWATVATAFCLSGPDMPDINSQEERKHELLNELTGMVAETLLGLQLRCAQCHDHKYDPLSQFDFYRLRAVFEPAVQVRRNESISVFAEPAEAGGRPASRVLIRGDWRRPGPEIRPGFVRVAKFDERPFPPDDDGLSTGRRAAVAAWMTDPRHPLVARVMANRIWQQHFGRGIVGTASDFGVMGDPPTHPELLDYLASELIRGGWSLKRLRRLILRSGAYRQRSFLDAAASDAERRGWQALLKADPDNELLSRYPRRRLDAESLRDASLAVSNSLNLQIGGPGVRPPLAPELVATLLRGQWEVSPDPEDHYRRSIYIFARRNLRYPVLEAFDRPAANASCAERGQSTTATQALLLFNSRFSLDAARRAAGWAAAQSPQPEMWVRQLYQRLYHRRATPNELRRGVEFLGKQAALVEHAPAASLALAIPQVDESAIPAPLQAALTDLCLALLNSNEFVYLD